MIIKNISVDGFKNLVGVNVSPEEKVNIICGENAQGKTNLIEAVWLMSGAKSFRSSRQTDIIGFDKDIAKIDLSFDDGQREQNISVTLQKSTKEKKILLNGVKQRSLSNLFGVLKCVVFTPEDLELSKGSPDVRRSFIDLCISQIKPQYAKTVSKYETVLAQRNTLLKNIAIGISSQSELDVWDIQLARLGAYISVLRYQYTKKLGYFAGRLYDDISKQREEMTLSYASTVFEDLENQTDYNGKMADVFLEELERSRVEDIRLGYTTVGVHRDDIIINIGSVSAKDYGSQGQNRSAALCLKLGQAYILYEETNDMPVILLDDVLSELDKSRKDFVLSQIANMQIFITCCEPIDKISGGMFLVKSGKVQRVR